jgi:hypothetical protein
MSNPDEHSDAPKPVVKDKNPHNYRKVGYSMIVISVSLVLIGLLVWAIGDNYHFSSDIMANQEIDAMTPKHGFNLVFYDTQQPVGAKLKLLDSASTIDDAQQKQIQYVQQNPSPLGKVLIFNETLEANKQLVHDTVAAITQYQADLAKAQAAKAQSATQAAPVIANQTTSATPTTQNSTSSNIPKVVITNATKVTSLTNATVTTLQNKTTSVTPIGQSHEKIGISENVTTNMSHVAGNASSTTNQSAVTNVNATQHQKSISISESIGLSTK